MLKNSGKMISVRYLLKKISVLDSNFIHRYIIIKCRSSTSKGKSTKYFWSYGPLLMLKNGFSSIIFEKISELDSYFIHKHIVIKYRSSLIQGKIHQLCLELRYFINVEKYLKNGSRSISFEKI